MVTVVLVIALLAVVSIAFTTAVITGLDNSSGNRRSSRFTAEADAGIDHTIRKLGELSVGELNQCTNGIPLTSTPTVPGDANYNQCTTVGSFGSDEDYITVITPTDGKAQLAPPTVVEGFYTIVSQVFDKSDDFVRRVDQTVKVSLLQMPTGIFAHNIDGGGTPSFSSVSMFTDGYVKGRKFMTFEDTADLFYKADDGSDIGAGVHAVGAIYEKTNGTDPIHPPFLNCDYPYDEDANGGDTTTFPACTPSLNFAVPSDSLFTIEDLYEVVDPDAPALDEDTYAQLKERAISQGTYWGQLSGPETINANDPKLPADPDPDAVYYLEYPSQQANNRVSWKPTPIGLCEVNDSGDIVTPVADRKNGTIVVRNGGLKINAGTTIYGAIFVPEGEFSGQGTSQITGTLWADTIGSIGTIGFELNDCWLDNMPSVFTVPTLLHYQIVDR